MTTTTDAERNRWLLKYLMRTGLMSEDYCQPGAGMTPQRYWVVRSPAIVNRSVVLGYGRSQDDAIDAAMKETP